MLWIWGYKLMEASTSSENTHRGRGRSHRGRFHRGKGSRGNRGQGRGRANTAAGMKKE